jgi:hypothetical protein
MYLYCIESDTIPFLCSLSFLTVLKIEKKGFILSIEVLFVSFNIERLFNILYIAINVPVRPIPALFIYNNILIPTMNYYR